MSDPETRDAIREVVFEGCPLRELLKKPCPHFGTSGSCRDCSYDWMTIATNVRKVAEKRRASYEREHEKVRELKKELEENAKLVGDIAQGFVALKRIGELAIERMENGDTDKVEETDVGQSASEDSES